MYKLKPISERVAAMREKYRTTQPELCIARYRLITEFYMAHPELEGVLRRAKNFRNICENIPVRIDDGEVIVGAQTAKYRAAAIYPENSVDWLKTEVESRYISTRDLDPYILAEEDRAYILDTIDYWMKECQSAKTDAQIIDEYFEHAGNGVLMFGASGHSPYPVGHFAAGYATAMRRGFADIKAEADRKKKELVEQTMPGNTIEQYNFYRAVSIVCEGMITLTKRYAALAREKMEAEKNEARRAELAEMVETLERCMDKPCETFHDAVQGLFMYQTCMCLDSCMHGISFGRVDQYLYPYYKADLEAGRITPEYAQELMDLFYLKVAEMNKPWGYGPTQANPGYTSGMLMTMGGVDKDGNDATNDVTYMMLQASGRLILHDPPQALRIHKNTPKELWEAAIETTKIAGGVPTFESDDAIIPALMSRGMPIERARDYTLIGCVEPSGCGFDWPACGGTGTESYINLANAMWMGLNNGYMPMPLGSWGVPKKGHAEAKHLEPDRQVGLATGYLYEFKSFDEVLESVKKQIEYFTKWHIMNVNSFEYVAKRNLPLPVVSCTIEGCMDKGKDVMDGGALYNSTGVSGVGIGNVADSLGIIRQLCFDEETKRCTPKELYDALMANWEGYEDLRHYVKSELRHYGNGFDDLDQYAQWASKVFSDTINVCTGPRGRFAAGLYPVTTNVMFGRMTAATPDGRLKGEPLADGISPVQQMDTHGPTAILRSVAEIKQCEFPNGTLLNMKFSPNSVKGEDGVEKLANLMKSYFALGGMEMQINVISAEDLKAAQREPENYKNLVVRVAGFSAYFVELHITGQNDLISRTELEM